MVAVCVWKWYKYGAMCDDVCAGVQVPYVLRHQVASYECDVLSRMRLVSLLLILQEAAELHAASLGFGYDFCVENGAGWVQLSLEMELVDMPRWKDVIEVQTCSADLGRLVGVRDYLVYGADGGLLARATSHWVLISMQNRRPLPLLRVLSVLPAAPAVSLGLVQRKLVALESEGAVYQEFLAQNQDIDMNCHVNHAVYVAQALNGLDDGFLRGHLPVCVSLNFIKEMKLGELARVLSRVEGVLSEHSLLLGDGRPAANVRIEWRAC